MDKVKDISFDGPKAELLKLLQSCPFSRIAKGLCPLLELRNNLSIEGKHAFVAGLTKEEVGNMLEYHKGCYEKCMFELLQD